MKARVFVALAALMIVFAAGCAPKPPDLRGIPTPKPPPGPNPVAAPGSNGPGPKAPAPPAPGK